jgi:hypothetical protein
MVLDFYPIIHRGGQIKPQDQQIKHPLDRKEMGKTWPRFFKRFRFKQTVRYRRVLGPGQSKRMGGMISPHDSVKRTY